MTMGSRILLIASLTSGLCLGQAATGFTFATQVTGASPAPLALNGTIAFPVTSVGSSTAVTLIITSSYPDQWTITKTAVTGTGFAATAAGTPVPAKGTASFLITDTPVNPGPTSATLTVTFSGPAGASAEAVFNLSSVAVNNLLISYVLGANGNQTLLADGGTLAFPQTPVGTSVSATISITNRTPGTVILNSVLLLGAGYQLNGLPLFPQQIGPGASQSFTVAFTPTTTSTATATLTITLGGVAQRFTLTGQGTSASFTYDYGTGSSIVPVSPGGTIPLGSAAANSGQNRLTITVHNTGNVTGSIPGIFVSTNDFNLLDLPSLPATIAPGASLSFTLVFAPKNVGALTATLSIGNATFTLSGTSLGPNLTVSLIVGSQKTVMPSGATATLPNTQIGSKLNFGFQVDNTGNQSASITALSIVGSQMSIVQPPTLPLTIPAGGSVQINGVFIPTSTGIVNGFLQLQDQTYGLKVVGDPPPALPAITFVNVTPQMSPLLQPAFGITLAKAYAFDLTGIVNLGFTADALGDDPNVQFITGTRFVTFRIPAGATQALFGSGAGTTTAPFQTGTTAGTIKLATSFSLGTYDVTAGSPLIQSITIAQTAPTIVSVAVASQSASSVTLLITGYSTPRSIKSLVFQFTPAIGATLQTTTLTADVAKDFDTWFQSTAGVSFGSQFSLTVQLNVSGSLTSIASVAVSATNSQGTSTPKVLPLN